MLDEARERLSEEEPSVAGRVTFTHGDVAEATALLGGGFALVCSHALLPVALRPAQVVDTMAALARPGAVVSLVFKNAAALAMRAGLEGRFADATRLLEGARERDDDGRVLASHTLDEIAALATSAGIEIDAWYGVQAFTHHRHGDADDDTVRAAVELEERAGRTDPYRRVARLLHVVGHRA